MNQVLAVPEDFKQSAEYGCSDPRLHHKAREQGYKYVEKSTKRQQKEFEEMEGLITDYIDQYGCIP